MRRGLYAANMAWTKLAAVGQLPPGGLIEVEYYGNFYALCNVGGECARCPACVRIRADRWAKAL